MQSVEGPIEQKVGEGEFSVSWSSLSSPALRHPCSCFSGFWTQIGTYTITWQFPGLWPWSELNHQLWCFFSFQPRTVAPKQASALPSEDRKQKPTRSNYEGEDYGLNCVHPNPFIDVIHPHPKNRTLFGERVFTKIIQLK